MKLIEQFTNKVIPDYFFWLNEPARYLVGEGLEIFTDEKTDFWQRTHYGFQRDNGHCLLTQTSGDFIMTTHVNFQSKTQYDQCGLMVRIDADNWIKVSTELEDTFHSRLGSVVTNLGFSDWATQDISSDIREMWYRVTKTGKDFLLENSFNGKEWLQLRVTHLHNADTHLDIGVYACSPIGKDFWCKFTELSVEE